MKSAKPPAKKSSSPQTPLLLLIPVLVTGILVFALTRPAPYTPEITGRPSATIDQAFFDYGDVKMGEMVNTSFKVTNTGDETLLIYDTPYVEVMEGCCPPMTTISSKRLKPGESATVSMQFTMHPGMGGYHDFRVHVVTSDPEKEHQQVKVLSNWVD